VKDSDLILYEIFPDRFFKGGTYAKKYKKWEDLPNRNSHFGGNLRGIKEKIPYLKELGINCLYLTPIFKAKRPHKYDTENYMEIDPNFGNMNDFDELLQSLHEQNIRLILDGVFLHTGDHFWAFKDAEKKDGESLYWQWYFFNGYPVKRLPKPNYENSGIYYLPRLNHNNEEVIDYLKQVVAYWTLKGIDGWRFDMPWHIGPVFWNEIVGVAKNINSDIILIGEYWNNPSEILEDYPFHGVMDYIFRNEVIKLLKGEINPIDFAEKLKYKTNSKFNRCWNMLGSHDTSRIRGVLKSDAKVKIAFTLAFTIPGNPIIYYGDEIGMFGGKDPDCRRTFVWDEKRWDLSIYEHIKNVINFRRTFNKIQNFDFVKLNNYEISYLIENDDRSYLININLKEFQSTIKRV